MTVGAFFMHLDTMYNFLFIFTKGCEKNVPESIFTLTESPLSLSVLKAVLLCIP